MDHRQSHSDPRGFIDQIAAKQRNVTWPAPLINSRAVDVLLWRGSANVTPVQRIGICLFGIVFLLGGVVLIGFAREERSVALGIFAFLWILLGLRVCWNGVRRRPATTRE